MRARRHSPSRTRATRRVRRRLAGVVWLSAWGILVWGAHAPWRQLGGLVDERLRWLERLVLCLGFAIGCTLGEAGREAATAPRRWTHRRLLRRCVLPAAGGAAAAMAWLRWLGAPDVAGVVLVALLAYLAGFDSAFGAWPLVCGRAYHWDRPLPPEPPPPEDPGRAERETDRTLW